MIHFIYYTKENSWWMPLLQAVLYLSKSNWLICFLINTHLYSPHCISTRATFKFNSLACMYEKTTVKWRMSYTERRIQQVFFLIALAERKTTRMKNNYVQIWDVSLTHYSAGKSWWLLAIRTGFVFSFEERRLGQFAYYCEMVSAKRLTIAILVILVAIIHAVIPTLTGTVKGS
jgi:hypothetical protein